MTAWPALILSKDIFAKGAPLSLVWKILIGVGIAIPTILLTVLPVNPGTIEPAEVFLPDVAAVVVNDLDWFSDADLARLEAIAPLDVWQSRYECSDSTPLVFDPNFNHAPPRRDPNGVV